MANIFGQRLIANRPPKASDTANLVQARQDAFKDD